MAVFQAFRALRPIPEKASSVAALPYDVVTREEARQESGFIFACRPPGDGSAG